MLHCDAGPAMHQVGADEGVEVAVEHAVHVADFELGAVVLDEPVGLQGVGADLVAEADVALGFVEFAGLFLAPLEFVRVEARA